MTGVLYTARISSTVEVIVCVVNDVREVMGSIPFFFLVPRSSHVGQITFHISLPSLKFTIFIHLLRLTLDNQ